MGSGAAPASFSTERLTAVGLLCRPSHTVWEGLPPPSHAFKQPVLGTHILLMPCCYDFRGRYGSKRPTTELLFRSHVPEICQHHCLPVFFKLATYDHLTMPHLDRINAAFSGFSTQTPLRHLNSFTLTCITSVQPSELTGKSAHFLWLRLNISLPSYLRVVTFPPAATEELTRSLSLFLRKEIVKEKNN